MITDADLAYQVSITLGTFLDEHDVAGIVREILDTYGNVDVDSIDTDEYWALVQRHAL